MADDHAQTSNPAEAKSRPFFLTEAAWCSYQMIALDFNLIKEESSSRTEFNRRTLNLQVSLITGVLAAGLIKDFSQFDPFILQVVCISVVLINAVFLTEINQNNFYIALSALYISKILNKRAKSELGEVVSEWECFLHTKREKSKSIASRFAFIMDAHFLMSTIFIIISTTMLALSIFRTGVHHVYVLALLALIAYPINFYCIYRHFKIPSEISSSISDDEIEEFIKRYYN